MLLPPGRVVGYTAGYGPGLSGTRWGRVLEVAWVDGRLLATVRNIHTGELEVACQRIIHTVMPASCSA